MGETRAIVEIENLDTRPADGEVPNTAWGSDVTLGEKFGGAFTVSGQEEADFWMLMLVGHCLRFDSIKVFEDGHLVGVRPLSWKEAFDRERESLAWFALAKDIGDFELYTQTEDGLLERRTHRDFVWRMYKAALPKRVTGNRDRDVLERVHLKREKTAKGRGECYWRKGHVPQKPQGSLF